MGENVRVDFTYQCVSEYARIELVGTYLLAAQAVWEKLYPLRERIHCLVDFGCGAGKSSRAAALCVKPKGKVIGVDISVDMIMKARKLTKESKRKIPDIDFQFEQIIFREGWETIPLQDGLADATVTIMVIQEMHTEEQLQNAFREIGRITKKGGYLVAVCDNDAITCEEYTAFTYLPFPENKHRTNNIVKCQSTVSNIVWESDRLWSREIIARFVEEAGFRISSIDYPLANENTPPFPDDLSRSWKDELRLSPLMVLFAAKV
jgi:SAM-dependent methyltransferase